MGLLQAIPAVCRSAHRPSVDQIDIETLADLLLFNEDEEIADLLMPS